MKRAAWLTVQGRCTAITSSPAPSAQTQQRFASKKRRGVSLKRPKLAPTPTPTPTAPPTPTPAPTPFDDFFEPIPKKAEQTPAKQTDNTPDAPTADTLREARRIDLQAARERLVEERAATRARLAEEDALRSAEEAASWEAARTAAKTELLKGIEEEGGAEVLQALRRLKKGVRRKKKKNTPPEKEMQETVQETEVEPIPEPTQPERKKKRRRSKPLGMTTEVPQLLLSKVERAALNQTRTVDHNSMALLGQEEEARDEVKGEEEKGAEVDTKVDVASRRRKAMLTTLSLIEDAADSEIKGKGKTPAVVDTVVEEDDMDTPIDEGRTLPQPTNLPRPVDASEDYVTKREKNGVTYRSHGTQVYLRGAAACDTDYAPYTEWEDIYANVPPSRHDALPHIIKHVEDNGFDAVSTVQRFAMPFVLGGADMVVQSQTGTGKTLAYLIPAICTAVTGKKMDRRLHASTSPSVLILSPSRVVAKQVHEELNKLLGVGARTLREHHEKDVEEGTRMEKTFDEVAGDKEDETPQISRTGIVAKLLCEGTEGSNPEGWGKFSSRGCDILVATVSALSTYIAHFESDNKLYYGSISQVVIDEPDAINMKLESLRYILRAIHTDKYQALVESKTQYPRVQVTLWGATPDKGIKGKELVYRLPELIRLVNGDPKDTPKGDIVKVTVGTSLLNPDVQHRLYASSYRMKFDVLNGWFRSGELSVRTDKIIIFCKGTNEAEQICTQLRSSYPEEKDVFEVLTGDLDSGLGLLRLKGFRRGKKSVLITTDMSVRGLDAPECNKVVCLGLPHSAHDWVHAVGRCSRSGRPGVAYTVFTHLDVEKVPTIMSYLRTAHPESDLFKSKDESLIRSEQQDAYATKAFQEEGEEGIVVKKIVVGDSLEHLAKRMGTTLLKMGIARDSVQAENFLKLSEGEYAHRYVDSYDPHVKFGSVPSTSNTMKRVQARIHKTVVKKRLHGEYAQEARFLMMQSKGRQRRKAAMHLLKNPVHAKAVLARNRREEDAVAAMQAKTREWSKNRRDSQINAWRKRTGITDPDAAPPSVYEQRPPHSAVPAAGTQLQSDYLTYKYQHANQHPDALNMTRRVTGVPI